MHYAAAASSALRPCTSVAVSPALRRGLAAASSTKFDAVVVGAGIVGVTTAHALCAAGLRVCVIDRHSHVAAETSRVSSGQLEPVRVDHMRAYSDPAALGLRGLFNIATSFPRWTLNYLLYEFKCRFLPGRAAEMTEDIRAMGRASLAAAHEYEARMPGRSGFRFGRSTITSECTFPIDPSDPAVLASTRGESGGPAVTFRSHEIATGSPSDLCEALEAECRSQGAEFRYGCGYLGTREAGGGGAVRSILTSLGEIEAGACVFCTGIASDRFFPCLPIWGIIREYAFDKTPARGLFGSDDILVNTLPAPKPGQQSYVVVVEHGGKRVLRLGGGAEVTAAPPPKEAFAAILQRVGGHGEPLRDWIGCRSVSPDGCPVVGLLPGSTNSYINCGQSFWGYTLSFGSARLLADYMTKGTPIPRTFDPSRFVLAEGEMGEGLQHTTNPQNP